MKNTENVCSFIDNENCVHNMQPQNLQMSIIEQNQNQHLSHQSQSQKQSSSQQNSISHYSNFLCFHNCSVWVLNILSIVGKKSHQIPVIYGRISSKPNLNGFPIQNIPQNIIELLPLDLQFNQRFVLDPNHPKTSVNLQFDFSKVNSNFSNVTKVFSVTTFDFNINSILHGNSVFKNNINFKVKGFDILKSIQSKLKEITISNNLQNEIASNSTNDTLSNNSQAKQVYSVNVFNNIQCSFSVEFNVNNMNIAKFISNSEQNINMNIEICEIKISKLNFLYTLPLSLFLYKNLYSNPHIMMNSHLAMYNYNNIHMNNYLNYMRNYQMMLKQNNQKNMNVNNKSQHSQIQQKNIKKVQNSSKNFLLKSNITISPYLDILHQKRQKKNFCNWFSFMTSTTPVYIESENIYIMKDIFYSLKKPSLFGVKCTFQLKNNNCTHVNYYPAISSINVYIQDQNQISFNAFPKNQNNGITFEKYENSFDSQLSSRSLPGINTLNVIQNTSNNFQFETLSPNCSFNSITESGCLNLSNLSSMSYRSINYEEESRNIFGIKNLIEQLKEIDKTEPEIKTLTLEDIDKESWFSLLWYPLQTYQSNLKIHGNFIQEKNLPIFKVFYQFHQGRLTHKGKFITVIGILPLTKTLHEQILNENFWFKNNNDVENDINFKYNKKVYYSLVEQARLIEI